MLRNVLFSAREEPVLQRFELRQQRTHKTPAGPLATSFDRRLGYAFSLSRIHLKIVSFHTPIGFVYRANKKRGLLLERICGEILLMQRVEDPV
jgi:hypothetical protein